MKAPKQNCPRCNAIQSFRPQRRDSDGGPGVIDVYIRCTVCRWEQVLRRSTLELEVLMANDRKHKERARIQKDRHGVVNGATRRVLSEIAEAMQQVRKEAGI